MKLVNAFWFRNPPNYGDILTPYIMLKSGIVPRYTPKERCQAIMVGSIARLAGPGVAVLGSGFIRKADAACPLADWKWVRGPISRRMVMKAGGKVPEIYGDAALLLPRWIEPANKKYDVGYIPHHVDYHLNLPGHKIDLLKGGIENITREITRCRTVISSSLHGIIVAHAYGIPAAWVRLSNKLTGDGMKFHDHYESVGLKATLSTLDNPVFQVPSNVKTEEIRRIIKDYAG